MQDWRSDFHHNDVVRKVDWYNQGSFSNGFYGKDLIIFQK